MSRYQENEPDYDRYEPKPVEDIDVPDFDQPDPPVDPAEHAAHALIDALAMLEREIVTATDFERVMVMRRIVRQATERVLSVGNKAADRCDEMLERRR